MLQVEAPTVLELLPIIRRWPSVAAALSVHVLALAAVLLSPDPSPLSGITVVDFPALSHPRPPSPSASTAGSSRPRAHQEKHFTKAPAPEPATADPVPVDVALSAEPPMTFADPTLGGDAGTDSSDGASDGGPDSSGPLAGDASGDGDAAGAPGGGQAGMAATEPIRLSSQVEPPRLVHRVEPAYPAIARGIGIGGEVILECIIGADGSVRVQRVLRSVPLLDAAAVAAVMQWRYEPARLNGHPQAVYLKVRVTFSTRG